MFVKILLSLALLMTPFANASAKTVTPHKPTPIIRHCATEKTFDLRANRIYVGLRSVQNSERLELGRMEKCATPQVKANEKATATHDRRAWLARQREPMAYLAWKYHHWDATQVYYEWKVLWHESRSSPGHLDLTAVNGDCYGSGQLMGSSTVDAYSQYDGNYYTVIGQETADLNYVAGRYGSPEVAWEHEEADNWY